MKVEEGDSFNRCYKPAGEYYLDFPEEHKGNTTYDLGNGFCGVYRQSSNEDNGYVWAIYLLKSTELPIANKYGYFNDYQLLYNTYIEARKGFDSSIQYVNVAYNFSIADYTYDAGLGMSIYSELTAIERNGKYQFVSKDTFDASLTSFYLFLFATGVTTIICTAIYFSKRKKQSFEF